MQKGPATPAVVLAVGTRPEAIKLAAVAVELQGSSLRHELWSSGQHRGLLDQTMSALGLEADLDLAVMVPDQTLDHVLAAVVDRFGAALDERPPALVVVQGDTTTALACALAAFHRRIPIAHVEAGLRSGHTDPFPEEANRALIDRLATLQFAPTEANAANLRREDIADAGIHVVGNPGLDTLRRTLDDLGEPGRDPVSPTAAPIVLTAHRRESHGDALRGIYAAARALAHGAVRPVLVVVHRNPAVEAAVEAELGHVDGVDVVDPVDYPGFVGLIRGAALVLTDSGGVQEEAAYLDRPVLVLRDHTERPEGLTTGHARLVGTDPTAIVTAAREALRDRTGRQAPRPGPCPYGDGHSAPRIVRVLEDHLERGWARPIAPVA